MPAKLVRPRDLRDALNIAFVHRTGVRWLAGTSAMLDLRYDGHADGATTVDVRHIPDFTAVRVDRGTTSIGAFAHPDALTRDPALPAALGTRPLGPHEARFRLASLGATVLIAGPGATRTATLHALTGEPLPPHEVPVSLALRRDLAPVWFGDRRIKRRDGRASFELRVHVALALSGAHRIERATVAHGLDGGPPVLLPAVAAELSGAMIARTTFALAARRAADTFRGDDERTNVLRRTIIPLVLSALKDAYAASRAAPT